MSRTSPLYVTVARRLEDDICSGVYAVGDLLPTETCLCSEHGVSRFTVRNALAMLEARSLIERTQGRGSVVISQHPSSFNATWSSIDELLAHASEVRTVVESVKEVTADTRLVAMGGFVPGEQLIRIRGVRYQGEEGELTPLCTIRIWFLARYSSITENLKELEGSVLSLIESHFDDSSVQVNQTISACTLEQDAAEKLNATDGEPALRLVRQFIDRHDRVFEVSETVFPSTKFQYNMRLKRS